ncbi:translationally-controlled tumor [Pelobates cultripes]|uniref:Translationally-controlled tumor n=1 Tax=Pelobates cultripes TaxID=61616 RepID=A0AAD1W833_PELCU|nr:translationally-controlled tumor [Pelobates cultripes]
MIIYRDIISGDEMFSDIYKIKESSCGLCYEFEGKMVSRTEGPIDDALIGGNASAECPNEGSDLTTVTGVDIKTQDSGKLEETNPTRVKPFMTGAAEKIKDILGNFKNYQFLTGEGMNTEAMVALLDFREDGITPFMIFFKDGLELEKC